MRSSSIQLFKFWQPKVGILILCLAVLSATVLHFRAGYHFPTPWDDEAYFLIPAIHFSKNLTLAASELNAPRGLFWMPHGYSVFMGLIFLILPASLETARLVSLLLTLTFSICLYFLSRRLGIVSLLSAVPIAIWLVSPSVVAMANLARMESLVLAIIGLSLILIVYQKWIFGIALSSLAVLVHPIGILSFSCFLLAAFLFRKHIEIKPKYFIHWLVIGSVIAIWLIQALYFVFNLDLAVQHLAHNAGNQPTQTSLSIYTITVYIFCLMFVVGALICWTIARINYYPQLSAINLIFLLAASLVFVTIVRNEIWYKVYQYTAILLGSIALLALIPYIRSKVQKSAIICLIVLCFIPNLAGFINYSKIGYMGMKIDGDKTEWQDFVSQVKLKLKDLDKSVGHREVVKIDYYNSINLFILNEKWDNLNFVTPTEITPMNESVPVTYSIYSLDKPLWKSEMVVPRLPKTGKLAKISSQKHNFELIIFHNETTSGSTEAGTSK